MDESTGEFEPTSLLDLIANEEDQIAAIDEAESAMPSAFSFTQDEIDDVLRCGSKRRL